MATLQQNNSDSVFQDALSDPVVLAMSVLSDRIKRLPKEDRDDLYELSKVIFSTDDEEERKSATEAMSEILQQETGSTSTMVLPDGPTDELSGWLEHVSQRLHDARKKAGLTQEQLAAKAGLPQSHISRLETRQHSPSAKTIEKIAAALGLEPSHFDPSA